jgi:hypothetical protein
MIGANDFDKIYQGLTPFFVNFLYFRLDLPDLAASWLDFRLNRRAVSSPSLRPSTGRHLLAAYPRPFM